MVWQTSSRANFPSFLEGLSLRQCKSPGLSHVPDFPSFLEGLSLRPITSIFYAFLFLAFPLLFGGAFIEARTCPATTDGMPSQFPLLFGGAFIEANGGDDAKHPAGKFPLLFGGAFIEAMWKPGV